MSEEDLSRIVHLLYEIRHRWYDLGLELEFNDNKLDEIKEKNKDNSSACLMEMLTVWLSSIDQPPTREALADALRTRAINQEALAERGKCTIQSS